MATLTGEAVRILGVSEAHQKADLTRKLATAWQKGSISEIGRAVPPERPARPAAPELRPPKDMPRRRLRSPAGRIALLHAVQHIELNAVDLALDMIARFAPGAADLLGPESLAFKRFLDDWIAVSDDEARHFLLLEARLAKLGASYGDLPAHDGLWEAAIATRHDILARLAVVPLVLEARGLDVAPKMIRDLDQLADHESADVLRLILREEIGHVAIGRRWFTHFCRCQNLPAIPTWKALLTKHFRGQLKMPFNHEARKAAGFPVYHYQDLTVTEAH